MKSSSPIFKNFRTKDLVLLAIIITLEIILSRFLSIAAANFKFGFGFVPIIICAMLYGKYTTALVYALCDFVGAILFPIGPYYPGFTFSALLSGFIFGYFLYQHLNLKKIITAVLINQILISFLLNSYWISVLYVVPFKTLLVTRIIQVILTTLLQIVVIKFLAEESICKRLIAFSKSY